MKTLRHISLITVILFLVFGMMAGQTTSGGNVLNPSDTLHISAVDNATRTVCDEGGARLDVKASVAPVTISGGGSMTLVSPHSVVLKPGTRVEAGGKLIVKVTPADPPKRIKKKVTSVEVTVTIPQKSTASVAIEKTFCVYPLPESGSYSALLNEIKGVLPARTKTTDDPDGFITLNKSSVQIPQSFLCTKSVTFSIGTGWGERSETIKILRT